MSLLGRLFESRMFANSAFIPPNSAGYFADSGESVTERTALQLVAVYACVKLLADAVAGLPMDVYRRSGSTLTQLPSPPLIAQPDSKLSTFEWLHQLMTSLALRGNAYGIVLGRDRLEYATEIRLVHPDRVMVQQDPGTFDVTYRVDGERIPGEDMVHIRRFTLPGYPEGLSPISAARQGIGLGLAAERYGARFFGDSANPSGVLSTDKDMTVTQAQENMARWKASHGGRRHPAFLSGGLKWQPLSILPDEAQFLQTRNVQRSEIAMLFGIPPHMIGDIDKTTSWGTGIEQQSIGWVRFNLRAWLICLEQALSMHLPRGQFVRFNVEGLLRGDTLARYQAYQLGRSAGWLSSNEIREKEDLPPIPEGDSYVQPLNFGPLGADPTPRPPAPPTGGQDAPA